MEELPKMPEKKESSKEKHMKWFDRELGALSILSGVAILGIQGYKFFIQGEPVDWTYIAVGFGGISSGGALMEHSKKKEK